MMTTTVVPTEMAHAAAHPDPGFGATFGAEWAKLRTARSPRRNLLLGVVLGVGMSVLLTVIVGATFDEWPAAEQADFDPIFYPLSGSILTAIFFAAVGVNVVASEYNSGMIRSTLTATPQRARVLHAKALTVAVATWIFGAIALAGMVGFGQLIFSSYDLPTAGIADGDLWRTVVLTTLVGPLFPVVAVAVTFLLRSTAGALCTVLALMFAPTMFGGLLPEWWQRNVLSLLPGPAGDSLSIGHLTESEMYLHPVPAAIVVVAWLVVALAIGQFALCRRDA